MNLVAFPSKKPSKLQLANITQIEYMIYKRDEDNDQILHTSAYNNRRPITYSDESEPNPYPWRQIPLAYAHPISIALYRLEILKIAANDTVNNGGNRNHIDTASINLHYLDMVLDRLWFNSNSALQANRMNGNWRCDVFDRWLRAEFHIHKHSPNDIANWETNNPDVAWNDGLIDTLGSD